MLEQRSKISHKEVPKEGQTYTFWPFKSTKEGQTYTFWPFKSTLRKPVNIFF